MTDNPDEGNWDLETELLQISMRRERQPATIPPFPAHLFRLDDLESLSLILNFNIENYNWNYECIRPTTTSFKVYLHRNDEIKKVFDRPIEVEIGKKIGIYLSPRVTSATPEVRNYAPKLRRCFFNSERNLKYFKTYTRDNCENECLMNSVEKECGCVKFSMPSKKR